WGGGLGVVLERREGRTGGRTHVAAVAPSPPSARGRTVREALGRACHLHRSFFWTVARLGSAGRRHFPDAVVAIPDREFQLGVRLGCRAPHVGRCGRQAYQLGLAIRQRSMSNSGRQRTPPMPSRDRCHPLSSTPFSSSSRKTV